MKNSDPVSQRQKKYLLDIRRNSILIQVSRILLFVFFVGLWEISARTGEGIPDLLEAVEEILRGNKIRVEKTFPYDRAGDIQVIRRYGQLLREEYRPDGIFIEAYVPRDVYQKYLF